MNQIFLPVDHVKAIKARVVAGDAPWAEAFAQLLAAGKAGLTQPTLSVQDNGGSPHFRVDGVYVPTKDGVVNTEANFGCRERAAKLSRVTMDLAMCWRFTGEARYADKALQLIHAWCLDRNTYMFPTGRVEDAWTTGGVYGGDVVMFLAFQGMFLAAHLLNGYEGWDVRAHAATRRWVRAMVEPQRPTMFFEGVEMYNNWDDSRCIYLCHGALMLDDLDLLIEVFDRWGQTLPLKMTDEGELPRETMRTRSMTYTLKALQETLQVAHVADRFGIDLFDLTVNGKTIRRAVDYVAHYLLHMDEWPFEMLTPIGDESLGGLSVFEIAYRKWGDPRYLDILNAYGARPARSMHATLLYGAATDS